MSYEAKMLKDYKMPTKKEIQEALLKSLFKHKGVIKEFSAGEEIVNEIADEFNLNEEQRSVQLETIYKKENRIKKSLLWHRLLFRAADNLAKEKLISRPTQTFILTNKREWMLTEEGYDQVLNLLGIPSIQKEILPVKSYEIQKIVKKITEEDAPSNYSPFSDDKKIVKNIIKTKLRSRGFRQAVIEVYEYKCAVCGMKLCSPDASIWEVEAAHIVPHTLNGKDDIWNGIALCRLHHWAFDVGWFTLKDNFDVLSSTKVKNLPNDFGKMNEYDFIRPLLKGNSKISLPSNSKNHPHLNSIKWHRENIFYP